MDANERIRDIMVVAEGLVSLLVKENNLLKERQYDNIQELVTQKQTLVKGLEAHYKGFEVEPDALKEADEDLREELRDLAEKIDRLTEENGRRLSIAIELGKILMETVTEAVKAAQPNAGTYAANGVVSQARDTTGKRSSLSLDDTF